ncbi:MAG: TraB/GumN family protein [Paramuribaculum sp.]|nr:TraB/GumN family protein [Paramuribaculum sp.]
MNILRFLLIACFSIAFAAPAHSQLLWSVTNPANPQQKSYLLGTHHVAPADMLSRVDGLIEALDEVDGVVGEIDIANAEPTSLQRAVMSYAMAPADSTLTVVFTKQQLDSINEAFSRCGAEGVKVENMAFLKPGFINLQLTLLQTIEAIPDFDPSLQFDGRIQNIAAAAGKPVYALEKAEWQLELLFSRPIAEQAEEVMLTVANDSLLMQKSQSLANAYLDENLDSISSLIFDPLAGVDLARADELIYDRNRNWMPQLTDLMKDKSVLIAVGCGHLVGPDGLLSLLRKEGYELTPVSLKK